MTSASDNTQIRDIQAITRLVLQEFDRVCTLLDINYTVYGGTAIGAVRHQGFIPWDDDGDICMPRADYERFLAEAPQVLDKKFVLVSHKNHDDFPQTFAVLGLAGSQFVSKIARDRKFRMPIGVDLFVLDTIPEDPKKFRSQYRSTWFWGRLVYLRGTPYVNLSGPKAVTFLLSGALKATHWLLALTNVKEKTLIKHWEKAARRYENSNSTVLGDFSTRDPQRWSATYEELFPARRMPFDDISVLVPHDYDAVLTRGYGDYMTIPPQDEQVNHEAATIVLGPNFEQND